VRILTLRMIISTDGLVSTQSGIVNIARIGPRNYNATGVLKSNGVSPRTASTGGLLDGLSRPISATKQYRMTLE